MLSIGRVAPAGSDYYLQSVADSPADYYTGAGEAPGQWAGTAATAALGLHGEVDPEASSRLLEGSDPRSGERFVAGGERRVGGFDLTFSAPKSVSLLWALHPDQATRAEVQAAHRAAVGDGLAYLEAHATWARRGRNGVDRVPVTGLVAAGFDHRTSRADDPQLHTHLVVANLVQDHAGRWSAPDSRAVYRHARTAGFVYQARLRHELTTRLGVTWGPVRAGQADLANIPRGAVEAFSTRRADVLHALQERGLSSTQAARVATLDTRTPKTAGLAAGGLHERWATMADLIGVDVSFLTGPGRHPALPDPQRVIDGLLGPDGLTAQRSTFGSREVTTGVAGAHPEGATLADLEHLTGRIADDDRVAPLNADRGMGVESTFTTVDLLALEADLETKATRPHHPVKAATVEAVDRAVADRPLLSGEQERMVRGICTTEAAVVAVVGKAGAGKTYALDAARAAWADSGIHVVGAALAARAAAELQAGSGIPSTTLARLVQDLERPEGRLLPGSVIVVDEAGMVGTRHLHHLTALAEQQQARLVLVGDPAQLPEISAGGSFAHLTQRCPMWELASNRRQVEGWERDTLDLLRNQQPAPALDRYSREGRITMADTAPALRAVMAADWHHAQAAGHDVVMLAVRRADVADLNRRAQAELITAGSLDPAGPNVDLGSGQTALVGDQVVCGRNDRHNGLLNGTRLTITTIPGDGTISGVDPDGRAVSIPGSYVADGHVALGYASTIHKAQGRTVDRALLLGDDRLFAEAGYVGLSRGRDRNQLYIVTGHNPTPLGVNHGLVDHVCDALGVSRAQHISTADLTSQVSDHPLPLLLEERNQLLRSLLTAGATRPDTRTPELREDGERLARLTAAIDHRADRLGQAALYDPSDHLTRLLGPVPDNPRERAVWAATASAVETWRQLADRSSDLPTKELLAEPAGTDPTHGWWRQAATRLDTHQTRLTRTNPDVDLDRTWQIDRTKELTR